MTNRFEVRKGIPVIITKEKLTVKMIQHRKGTVKRKIGDLIERNIFLDNEIKENETNIVNLRDSLNLLESKEVDEYIEYEKDQQELAQKKADNLLRGYIGDEAYKTLKSGKCIIFNDKDGVEYIITPEGVVGRKSGKSYRKLCVIKPKNIPLSDKIISILTSVKENPKSFPILRSQVVK